MALFCVISFLILLELRLPMLKRSVGCRLCFALLEVQINGFISYDCIIACYSLLLRI